MSEKFKMPEKWCVRGGTKMHNFHRDVLDNGTNVSFISTYYYVLIGTSFMKWSHHSSVPESYTEITFEQFKEYYYSTPKPVQKSEIEQLREKCKRLELTPLFSGAEFVTLELVECDGEIIHRLKEYRDFDKLCENALIILNLEE